MKKLILLTFVLLFIGCNKNVTPLPNNPELNAKKLQKEQEKEKQLLEVRNKIQDVKNKIQDNNKNIVKEKELNVSKNLKEIMENARYNSNKQNYLNKNFKMINGIYYFNVYAVVKNNFIVGYEEETKSTEFSNEIINSIVNRYVLNINDSYTKNIFGDYQVIDEYRKSKTINKIDLLIIGVKNIYQPIVYKECSKTYPYELYSNTSNSFVIDSYFTEIFKNNENQIRNYKSVYCLKDYTIQSNMEEILLIGYKQLKSYAFAYSISDSMKEELNKLEADEFNIRHNGSKWFQENIWIFINNLRIKIYRHDALTINIKGYKCMKKN